jgi:hypothetical protein
MVIFIEKKEYKMSKLEMLDIIIHMMLIVYTPMVVFTDITVSSCLYIPVIILYIISFQHNAHEYGVRFIPCEYHGIVKYKQVLCDSFIAVSKSEFIRFVIMSLVTTDIFMYILGLNNV